jgi:hypothetical protein
VSQLPGLVAVPGLKPHEAAVMHALVYPPSAGQTGKPLAQGRVTTICPASENVIVPDHMQLKVELLFSAGTFATSTVAEPGDHGAAVAGMQGCGVRLPDAEAVAAATIGLAGLWHMPKGAIFIIGM